MWPDFANLSLSISNCLEGFVQHALLIVYTQSSDQHLLSGLLGVQAILQPT